MRPLGRNLHLKIVILFVVAILPAATIAIILAISNYREAQAFKDSALIQSAQLVAAREGALIESIRGVLGTLSAQEAIVGGAVAECRRALATTANVNPAYAAIGLREGSGRFTCAAGDVQRFSGTREDDWLGNLSESAASGSRFALAAETLEESQTIAAAVPLAGNPDRALILIVEPGFLGSASLSMPYLNNASAALITGDWEPVSLYFRFAGIEWLPSDAGSGAELEPLRAARARDGQTYRYASVPIPETDLFVLSASPVDRLYQAERQQLIAAIAFPLALLLLSVATAWVAVDRLVLRWIHDLRHTAATYGAGKAAIRAATPAAMPNEIKDLADTFNAMAAKVEERSADLERAVEEKSQLLRELHHRVKNNFQVIASLLALQKRALGAHDRAVLRYSEDRVQAMATAYRVSYASGEIGDVGVGKLLQELLTYLRQSSEATAHLLHGDFDVGDAEVDLDTAIPLSLLLIEIMTPIVDQARQSGRMATLRVRRSEEGSLAIEATGPAVSSSLAPNHELSVKLSAAFVHQVSGEIAADEEDGQRRVRVTIPASRVGRSGDDEVEDAARSG